MQEVVENIALEKLKPFPNHPFKIREDEAMMETVESVKSFGVLQFENVKNSTVDLPKDFGKRVSGENHFLKGSLLTD